MFDDTTFKHLEFIQANIARMNQCSFQIKGWATTVITALLALYAASISSETGSGNNMFIWVAIAPTFVFWILDSYYLQQERRFRGVYNDLIRADTREKISPFTMPLDKYKCEKYCFFRVMWSITEFPLYLLFIVGLILAGLFL